MPEIPVGAQIFDVVFHPTFSTVYTGLLTGHVKAFAYDEQGNHQPTFSVRPSKSSCRGLSLDGDGSHLYAVGKGKALYTIDTQTEDIDSRAGAHDATINRVKHLMSWLLATGDDDGTVKLWDPRQRDCVRTYTQHFDYISDFLWLDDKRQLVSTSGDGTLSVMDVRSKKSESVAQSEDQEDELLSIVAIKGGAKIVVGTQIGILSIFNRSSGWGDCVDRVPGHPMSVDALCNLPPDIPNVDAASTILTGSSDGYVRAVQILPTKLIGVVADHGEWPIERISIGGGHGQLSIERAETSADKVYSSKIGNQTDENHQDAEYQRRWWVGSVGHEDVLRMSDLEGFFRDNEGGEAAAKGALGVDVSGGEDSDIDDDDEQEDVSQELPNPSTDGAAAAEGESDSGDGSGQDSDEEEPQPATHKRKAGKGLPLNAVKKKGRNTVAVERSFFDEL
ncbi:WD40 repeat-like protein [Pholiota conissans]|uniref:WD repeat-containing protein JIP5 n=1 Tax=Pholiota conissans TaxID=109636 RepID=A0A9P6CQP8_9AGAR|nr:WD40 repeat-like protein [Pholiota conissans]